MPTSALTIALVVKDHDAGDDRVHRAAFAGDLALAHAVADDLAAAELDLLSGDGQVALDLDDDFRVGQADAVAGGGTVKRRVIGARQSRHSAPPIWPRKPCTMRSPA